MTWLVDVVVASTVVDVVAGPVVAGAAEVVVADHDHADEEDGNHRGQSERRSRAAPTAEDDLAIA
jgi:hypothetical protein